MAAPLAPVEVIERSRRGEPVDAASVEAFVRSWLDGTVADALMSAWCMVACLREMPREHAEALMRALLASGDRLELETLGPTGDPHSTGGVGDTTPLVAAPLAAALGVRVATVGGRGLGAAGGTLDKLEAIPGFQVDLPLGRFVRQVRDTGIAVTLTTAHLAPADRRLTELRDATAAAPSPGLVAASVMSRAIAVGAGAISLGVTGGGGGAVEGEGEARRAAELMAALAGPWGRRVRWTVAALDQPLGRCVGNALEVREAGEVLCGDGSEDVRELALRVAGGLAEAAGVLPEGEGVARAADALASGAALAAAERWVEAQDGAPGAWTDPGALPVAPVREEVLSPGGGWIEAVDARGVGEAARWLGAGRLHPDQSVDPVAGVEVLAKVGHEIAEGEPVAVVHARDEWVAGRGREMVAASVRIGPGPVAPPALVVAEGRDDAGAA